MPIGITSIGDSMFVDCTSLTNFVIPDGITNSGYGAFMGCSSLTSVTIPSGLTSIGDLVFVNCGLYYIKNNSNLPISIGSYNHGGIAYSVQAIEDKDGNVVYNASSGIIENEFLFTIDDGGNYKLRAYLGNEETVTLPRDINGCSYSIYEMRGIRNVVIPDNISRIDDSAFLGCGSLIGITLPDSVTNIEPNAFYACSNLTSIILPSVITSIEGSMFYGCGNLTSVSIPDCVTTIWDTVFCDCGKLTDIRFGGTIEQWEAIEKYTNWDYNTGNYIVHCTDGDISKS